MQAFISDMSDQAPDLISLIVRATLQIPEGRVSTYGDIARGLGDVAASRVVGAVLAENALSIGAPCHRVVFSDGRVGWRGAGGGGRERAVRSLRGERVSIEEDKVVDLESIRFTEFDIPPVLRNLAMEQVLLSERASDRDDFSDLRYVAGIDVAYTSEVGFGASCLMDAETDEILEEKLIERPARFPYVPGYLGYREMAIVRDLFAKKEGIIYLIDGHGRSHPRRFGIASHLGVCLGVPTVGAAKSLLVGKEIPIDGRKTKVELDGHILAYGLTKGGKTRTYVSVGHRVSLETAVDICSRLSKKSSVPMPLRRAHLMAGAARKRYQEREED